MNIGEMVDVCVQMQIEGIRRDAFSNKIMIEGMIQTEKGRTFISIPEEYCTVVVVPS